MLGLFIFLIFLILIVFFKLQKKDYLFLVFMYVTIAPLIRFNNIIIDGSYLILILMIIIYLLNTKTNNKIIIHKDYFILCAFNLLLYLISSVINNNLEFNTIKCVIGFLKIPIFIFLVFSLYDYETVKNNFIKYLYATVIINIFVCFFQMFTKDKFLELFKILYSEGNDYYSFVSGEHCYSRTFGLFSSPVFLGNFSLFALSFFLGFFKEKKENIFFSILVIILGFLSATKTFVIGMMIELVLFIVINVLKFITGNHIIKKRTILIFAIVLIFSPFIALSINGLINLLSNNGVYIKYYLQFITSPFDALTTRYGSSDDLLLSKTYEVINNNFLIGVGFNSINGEFVGDSTYVSALHNGGIVSLISIIIFYLKCFFSNCKNNQNLIFILISFIVSGLGIPCLFNEFFLLPFLCFYLFSEVNLSNKEEINYGKSKYYYSYIQKK